MANLYRKSALEKISSPEQLDKALVITKPSSWIVLIGITIISIVTILWSVWGRIPITTSASGIIASPVSTNSIYTDETGSVVSVYVTEGSELHIGDTVMTVNTSQGNVDTIISNQVGTVSKILVSEGNEITQGSEILRVSPKVDSYQVVVCYVSLGEAKKLQRGMSVKVSLPTSGGQNYGHMEARVINIDSHATSSSGMAYVLGSDNNLSSVFTSKGAVVAVTCELYPSDDSVSGYYWSNKSGRKLEITNGSLVEVKIITEEIAPITKLFAKLKELWGE